MLEFVDKVTAAVLRSNKPVLEWSVVEDRQKSSACAYMVVWDLFVFFLFKCF